jgi:hypothetical protein
MFYFITRSMSIVNITIPVTFNCCGNSVCSTHRKIYIFTVRKLKIDESGSHSDPYSFNVKVHLWQAAVATTYGKKLL